MLHWKWNGDTGSSGLGVALKGPVSGSVCWSELSLIIDTNRERRGQGQLDSSSSVSFKLLVGVNIKI